MLVSHSIPLPALFRVGGSHLLGITWLSVYTEAPGGVGRVYILSQRCGPKDAIGRVLQNLSHCLLF